MPVAEPVPAQVAHAIEDAPQLDAAGRALARLAAAVVPHGAGRRLLRGSSWLGHPVHPLLTDIPIGFWTNASVLDVIGGPATRDVARRFVGLGVLSTVPTIAAGLAELTSIDDRRTRRVVVVHAAANAAATATYAWSWRARRRGRHVAGVALALAGMGIATAGGFLGGHLAFGQAEDEGDERYEA